MRLSLEVTEMDAILKAEAYEYAAYLTTARGEVWRIYYDNEQFPLMQRLTPNEVRELEGLRRRYAPNIGGQ